MPTGKHKRFEWRTFLLLSCSFLLFQSPQILQADDELGSGIKDAANDIIAVMKTIGAESITFKKFEDKTTLGATVLSGLRQQLSDQLTKKVTLRQSGGAVGLESTLSLTDQNLRIDFQLFDRNGGPIKDFNADIRRLEPRVSKDAGVPPKVESPQPLTIEKGEKGQSTLDTADDDKVRVKGGRFGLTVPGSTAAFIAFGANVDCYAPLDGSDMDALNLSIDKPTATIVEGTVARASNNSPFDLQIICNGRIQPLRMVDGAPFVDVAKDTKLSVRITNRSPIRVAAVLSLDGVNSQYFRKDLRADGRPFSAWLIDPRKSLTLRGWQVSKDYAEEFVASSYDKSVLKELGMDRTPVGAITVVFQGARTKGQPLPPDEYHEGGNSHYVAQPSGTFLGRGDKIQAKTEEESPEFGRIRGAVSIRFRHPESGK